MDIKQHECTAVHCVVCCPSARAYSDGVQFGKDFYGELHAVTPTPQDIMRLVIMASILTVIIVSIVYKYRNKVHSENTA